MGFDLNPHHSTPNTPRPSVNFKKLLYLYPSSLVDSPVAAVAAEEEERSTRQSMMVWDLNTPDRVSNKYRLISILGLFNGERTLSAVVKGLPPSLVNYAIDIVVFLLRYNYDEDDDDAEDDGDYDDDDYNDCDDDDGEDDSDEDDDDGGEDDCDEDDDDDKDVDDDGGGGKDDCD